MFKKYVMNVKDFVEYTNPRTQEVPNSNLIGGKILGRICITKTFNANIA